MRNRICLVLVAVFSAICFVAANNVANQDQPQEVEKQIFELRKQRRDILKERVEALESRHKEGQTVIMPVIHAKDDLYLAELDLTSKPKVRVELSKLRLQNMKQLEAAGTLRYANGVGTLEDKLVAVAARIQAEIDLLNEEKNLK